MGLLDGKKVLVTGARKGIGRGIAYSMAKEGADVGINDYIDDEETQKTINLVESLGKKSSKHIGDVSKKKNIDSIIDNFLEVHGNIDVLVNNAIMQPQNKPFFEIAATPSEKSSILSNSHGKINFPEGCKRPLLLPAPTW